MALRFLTNAHHTIDVVVTCDDAVTCTEEQRALYLSDANKEHLKVADQATIFTLKALRPSDREDAEQRAGAFSRSELGRLLWVEAPSEKLERAKWHHALSLDEREAMADYQGYISRVYIEMVRASLTHIDCEPASIDQVQLIRPDDVRSSTISELVIHI